MEALNELTPEELDKLQRQPHPNPLIRVQPLLNELDDFRRDFDKRFDEIKRKYFIDGQGIGVMLSKLPGCPISFFIDYEALKMPK